MNIGLLATSAAKAYLGALDPALTLVTNFYAEVEDPDVTGENRAKKYEYPCVICFAGAAQEYPIGTGNYSLELTFQIRARSESHTAEQFSELYEEVWAKISTDTILADLSAAADDFTILGPTEGIQQTQQTLDTERRLRIKSIVLPINCCASDLS